MMVVTTDIVIKRLIDPVRLAPLILMKKKTEGSDSTKTRKISSRGTRAKSYPDPWNVKIGGLTMNRAEM
jgi:hypothetical protein